MKEKLGPFWEAIDKYVRACGGTNDTGPNFGERANAQGSVRAELDKLMDSSMEDALSDAAYDVLGLDHSPTPVDTVKQLSEDRIALIDMDGTVADYDTAMYEALSVLRGEGEPPVLRDYPDKQPEYVRKRVNLIRRQDGFWRGLGRIDLGFEVLDLLRELGYQLVVLTKGPKTTTSAWTEKREWCHKHLPGVPVTITENKGLVYGKVLFDDYPPYIEAWLKWRPRGKVLMLDHPWNADFIHPQVFRVRTKKDLAACKQFLLR